MGEHCYWQATMLLCMIWYSTVTIYVGIRGFKDIKNMLARLSESS